MHSPVTDKPLLGCRILIVEDNFLLAETVADVLENAGARIVGPFLDMVEALERLTELTAIDGAILDIGLGDQESYPLAEALQTTNIPFMFLTGLEREDLPKQFARTPHMLKPFSEERLIRSLIEIGVTRD
ncbi:response regulator [Sphingomonas sp. CGMCC 1.13654]|uniref:Response regulator n=1 Tax=Sphingomonas chungangi TaxID=2683589 RepID=A0A838L3V4_9SPHN|nr:response regulator [Sphingomonas chungangi]